MITRPEGQNETLAESLRTQGAVVIEAPVLRCIPPNDERPLLQALRSLDQFQWVVFTSVNGVRMVGKHMRFLHLSWPASLKTAAIGSATAAAIRDEWPDVAEVFIPTTFVAEALGAELPVAPGEHVLLPRAHQARPVLPNMLKERQAHVTCVDAYDVVPVDVESFRQSIGIDVPDWIVLTSPSGIRALEQLLRMTGRGDWLISCRLACIGPVTAEACTRMGLTADLIADIHTENGLVDALSNWKGETG